MNGQIGRYGRYGEQSWAEWATTTSWLPSPVAALSPIGPLYAAKWAWDRSNEAAAAGTALRKAYETPAPAPAGQPDDAALQLLERRLADYKVDPHVDESAVPSWVAPVVGGGLATLLLVAALKVISTPAAPRRRRR